MTIVNQLQNHAHTLMHACTNTCVLVFRTGHMISSLGLSQQEATRLVAQLAAGTPASSPHPHDPFSAVGVLICMWACKTHHMREVGMDMSDSIKISAQSSNPHKSSLGNFYMTSICCTIPAKHWEVSREKVTQEMYTYTLPVSGVWFTSITRVVTKQKP